MPLTRYTSCTKKLGTSKLSHTIILVCIHIVMKRPPYSITPHLHTQKQMLSRQKNASPTFDLRMTSVLFSRVNATIQNMHTYRDGRVSTSWKKSAANNDNRIKPPIRTPNPSISSFASISKRKCYAPQTGVSNTWWNLSGFACLRVLRRSWKYLTTLWERGTKSGH